MDDAILDEVLIRGKAKTCTPAIESKLEKKLGTTTEPTVRPSCREKSIQHDADAQHQGHAESWFCF